MAQRRVLVIGLDGFERTVADHLIEAGRMPNLAKLRAKGASYLLDHGSARQTGLAWEHFSTGMDPDAYGRWSAIEFDPLTYVARQSPTNAQPFLDSSEGQRVVTFDVPYMDLRALPDVKGVSDWGAHDPGVARRANPPELLDEIDSRFGPYPAARYIYGLVWPSVDASERMADQMIQSVQLRTELTSWLLKTRLPDWVLAITVVSELHSTAEAFWHGIDKSHPLCSHPSATPARLGIEGVYVEIDRLIGRLQSEHPDANLVLFYLHGMGPNKADLATMALLPEVLYRRTFNRPFLHPRGDWDVECPMLKPGEDWSEAVIARLGISPPEQDQSGLLAFMKSRFLKPRSKKKEVAQKLLSWMPAAHYAPFWKDMDAFALPGFDNGRIRINLEGRESHGRVSLSNYTAMLDDIEDMIRGARDVATGEAMVLDVKRPLADDPFAKTTSMCDLEIVWRQNSYAMDVPGVGRVGPVPQRRPGGHTGEYGYALILSHDHELVDQTKASSFDIVPTILELANMERPDRIVGSSLLAKS